MHPFNISAIDSYSQSLKPQRQTINQEEAKEEKSISNLLGSRVCREIIGVKLEIRELKLEGV